MKDFFENFEMWVFLYITAAFTALIIQFLIKLIYRSI